MIGNNDPAVIADFIQRKRAQWECIAGRMLVLSNAGRYEGVVFGQMGHVVVERTTAGKSVGRRLMPNNRKPEHLRDIDLTDAEIDAVLAAWAAGRSALTVPAVTHVYDGSSHIKRRTSPLGFRGGTIRDVEFFNATGPAIVLWGVNGLRMSNVNGYTGGGVQSSIGVRIGGTAAVQSTDVQVSDCRWDSPINVTNTLHSGFEGKFWGGIQTDTASQQSCTFSMD